MQKNGVISSYEEGIIDLWLERVTALAEEFEFCAERYPVGSQNWLELNAKASGIRTAIHQFLRLDAQVRLQAAQKG